MARRFRANYALLSILEQLGPSADSLDLPWATFAGDRTSPYVFDVQTQDATDPYVEIQLYDVGTFDHEITINGEALSGFDLPPGEGWQYWMDNAVNVDLQPGENTLRICRDRASDDAFAVGNVVVNWKEPIESADD